MKRKLLFILLVIDRKIESLFSHSGIPFLKKSSKAINISILAEILGENSAATEKILKWLNKNHYIEIDEKNNKIRMCYDSFLNVDASDYKEVTYFSGENYIAAFKIMNRYLSK